MKGIRYILFLTIFLVSYPALANLPVYGSISESSQAQNFKPPKGKALVYIYQPAATGQAISPVIWINSYKIGRLVPGSFTVWKFSPGRLNIRLEGAGSSIQTLDMRAGQVYRFRLTTSGESAQIRLVHSGAISEIASTRLLKNPRTVTSVAKQEPSAPKIKAPVTMQSQPSQTEQIQAKPKAQEKPSFRSVSDTSIRPGGFELTLKTGTIKLSNGTQTILAVDRDFDENASGVFAAEFNYQFNSGLSVGGELIKYSAEFTSVGLTNTHTVDVNILLVNAKQYFRNYSGLQPYISAGGGLAVTDVSGPDIGGNTAGFAYQLSTGLQYRGSNVGVFGEIKYIGADTEDDNGESIDVTGTGLFAGVAFHF